MRRALIVLAIAFALPDCSCQNWEPGANCGVTDESCGEHGDCCSYACLEGQCACADEGVQCLTDLACCDGLSCEDGICACAGSGCETDCAPIDSRCDANTPCCADSYCLPSGRCGCNVLGQTCGVAACCDGFACVAGLCRYEQCQPLGTQCIGDTDCCSGGCVAGVCCGLAGADCGPGSACCNTAEGLICDTTNHCSDCLGGGDACTSGSQCCPGSTCMVNNTCCELPGGACTDAAQCCGQYPRCTNAGQCCKAAFDSCAADSECCSGDCDALGDCTCHPNGSPCGTQPDCCVGLTCNAGVCCGAASSSCQADGECCSGTCRPNGTCQ